MRTDALNGGGNYVNRYARPMVTTPRGDCEISERAILPRCVVVRIWQSQEMSLPLRSATINKSIFLEVAPMNEGSPVRPIRLAALIVVICGFCLGEIALSGADDLQLDKRVKKLPTDLLGPFVHTTDGSILALDSSATLVSTDQGKTWSEPRPLFGEDIDITVSNERQLLRTQSGTIIAAFMNLNERNWTWNDKLHDAPGAILPTYAMRSTDEGKTWTDIQKLHDEWSGCVRDMIQTSDGRVIFTAMKMLNNPGRHSVLTYSSTDDGQSWEASNLIDLGGQGHHGGVTEPAMEELRDGRVWLLIRTNWGEFWSGYSYNGGRSWRVLQPSGIKASSAPAILKRLESGRLMLVWNRPLPEGKATWPLRGGDGLWSEVPVSNHREELSVALSEDDGATWCRPVVVAKQASTSLAYPYLFEVEPGRIWLTTMQGNVRVELLEADFLDTEQH